jgi:hypothetical protein
MRQNAYRPHRDRPIIGRQPRPNMRLNGPPMNKLAVAAVGVVARDKPRAAAQLSR